MRKSLYKKILVARISSIRQELGCLRECLDNETIRYPEFLSLESILYNDLVFVQRELIDLDRKALL